MTKATSEMTTAEILRAEALEEIRQAEQSRHELAEAIAARLGTLDVHTLVKIARLIG